MARAIYPYELSDPDFSWLINSFKENNPGYSLVEIGALPMVLIKDDQMIVPPVEALLPGNTEEQDPKEFNHED